MALRLAQKQAVVEQVSAIAAEAHSAVATEYRGLTVDKLTELRKQARNSGVYLRVVKNSLAKRALDDTDFACMQEGLVGPLMLAFSMEEPGSAARLIREFSKDNQALNTKLVAIGGQVFGPSELERLAKLPTRDQALSMLMAVMKAPVEKFAKTLAELNAKLARTLAAVCDQKQAA